MTYSAVLHINGQAFPTATSGAVSGVQGYRIYFYAGEIQGEWGITDVAGKPTPPMTPVDMGAHSVDIFNNGVLLKTISVPKIEWLGGWMEPITPDTIVETAAALLARNVLPPYAIVDVQPSMPAPRTFAGPSDNAGITLNMANTGERPDIGFLTDPQAAHVLSPNQATFDSMIAEAKGFWSMPIWLRDWTTGKVTWDMSGPHYKDQTYGNNQGSAQAIAGGSVSFPAGATIPPRWSLDGGHCDMWPFVAFMMTKQMRYLRLGQAYQGRMSLFDNAWSQKAGYYVITQGQARSLAWELRNYLSLYIACLEAEKLGLDMTDCYGSAYYKKIIDNQLVWFKKNYQNDPAIQALRCWPVETYDAPWQQDHLGDVIAYAARILPAEWGDFCLWDTKNIIDRTSGVSGWPARCPTTYRLITGPGFPANTSANSAQPGNVLTLKVSQMFPDWASAWGNFAANVKNGTDTNNMTPAQIDAINANPNSGGFITWDKATPMFVHARLASLVDLDRKGILAVSAAFPNLEDIYALNHSFYVKQNFVGARQSIAVPPKGAVVIPVPPPPPPPPPPVQPPAKDLSMPSSTTLKVGETKVLGVTPTPPDADMASLTFHAVPDGIVTLAANDKGIAVTRVAPGTVKIFADVQGEDAAGAPAQIEAEGDAIDAIPLAMSLAVSWLS